MWNGYTEFASTWLGQVSHPLLHMTILTTAFTDDAEDTLFKNILRNARSTLYSSLTWKSDVNCTTTSGTAISQ